MSETGDQSLVEAAREAALSAYAPYSGFRVGAALRSSDGRVFTSANVENASYPVSQCAEANAINYAVSQGVRAIAVLAVACLDAVDLEGAHPCGRCRQIMSEFDVERIVVATAEGGTARYGLDDLLPHRFSF